MAIEKNQLKLNDFAQQYLPDTVKLPEYQNKQITLEQLAAHTSGLPVEPGVIKSFNTQKLYNYLKAQHITQKYTSDYFNIYPMPDTKFFGKIDDAVFRFKINRTGIVNFILDENGTQKSALRCHPRRVAYKKNSRISSGDQVHT